VWEIAEGDTKSLYTMKLVPLEDLKFHMPKVSIQALFNLLLLKMPREWVAPIDTKKKKKKKKKPLQAYQNTLEHVLH
jgi:hypothetical protein